MLKNRAFDPTISVFIYIVFALAFVATVGLQTTPHMAFSAFTYMLLVFGLFQRRSRNVHVFSMSTAIAFDFSLVLLLELKRRAIETTINADLSFLQRGHIMASASALLFYIPIIFMGLKLYQGKGSAKLKRTHVAIGMVAFSLRSVGFLLSFTIFDLEKSIAP